MDNEAKIIAAFKAAGKPLKAGELATQSGVDKKEVDKILKKLKKDEIIDSPQRCFYQIK